MKNRFRAISIVILVMIMGCSKSDEDGKPLESIFIRVKNTSLVNYLNVKIYADPSIHVGGEETGLLESGKLTEYIGFTNALDPFAVEVKVTENISLGALAHISNDLKALPNGKYTLEIFVPNRGGTTIATKLVKDE